MRGIRKRRSHLPSFHAVAAKAGVTAYIPHGLQTIRVARIVGSAGKADSLDASFLPRGPGPAQKHYRAIRRRLEAGEVLPPIAVYQLGYRYFVIDGHTRVAAAKDLGIEFVDAMVTEALPHRQGTANATYYARRAFERDTGLQSVRLTAPWRYHLLQKHVEGYQQYVRYSRDSDVPLAEAAAIWYRTQYRPTLLEIGRRKLPSVSGGHTAGDLYTDILQSWTDTSGRFMSLREMLDHYDQSLYDRQGRATRAKRRVVNLVDAALPKALSSITTPDPLAFEAMDVEADMEGLS